MKDELRERIGAMWYLDLFPYRHLLQGNPDAVLSAFLQQQVKISELPPELADHVRHRIDQAIKSLYGRPPDLASHES